MDWLSNLPLFWIVPIAAFIAAVLGITVMLVCSSAGSRSDATHLNKQGVGDKTSDQAQKTESS
jgi:hypothetical protein